MKKSFRHFSAALVCAAAVTLSPAVFAQAVSTESVTTTSTTTSGGTVTEFGGDEIVLRSETTTSPVRYSYSKSTTIVDEAGAPVDVSVVRSGVPVQVMYVNEGDRMVARKIVVKKAVAPASGVIEKRETKTTTTETHH